MRGSSATARVGIIWYEGTVQDITDRKRAEVSLRQAQEAAERSNQAKTRFLAAASHDLRQPYQAMRLLLHALECRQIDPLSQSLARRLDEAMTAGENLLNALLDISTLEGGMVRPHLANFTIDTVLDRLHGEFSPQAAAQGQELRFVSSTAGVRSDPVLLERIVRNLVLNAIRHSPGGRILVGCRRAKDSVRLEVWDTGPGIPSEKLNEIFEEFSQLENDERDSSRGHGLGLAIVKGLSRVLGHKVSVRSTLGRGSVFGVTLPATAEWDATLAASAAPVEPTPAGAASSRRSVLVIEDEPAQRMSLSLLLEDWGYRVRSATDLTSALRELDEWGERPSFVLSDFRLPGGWNGVEAIREIGRHIGHQVPGIILTGDTGSGTAERSAPERVHSDAQAGEPWVSEACRRLSERARRPQLIFKARGDPRSRRRDHASHSRVAARRRPHITSELSATRVAPIASSEETRRIIGKRPDERRAMIVAAKLADQSAKQQASHPVALMIRRNVEGVDFARKRQR